MTPITTREVRRMLDLWGDGRSLASIARRVGRGSESVRRHLRRVGVDTGAATIAARRREARGSVLSRADG